MEDEKIVDLFFARSEEGIARTREKYGKLCGYIAKNILGDELDAEECVNDAYLRLWNLIPPARPEKLSAFLGKLVRGISIDRMRKNSADKRGSSETDLIDDELSEVLGACDDGLESSLLRDAINRFLGSIEKEKKNNFRSQILVYERGARHFRVARNKRGKGQNDAFQTADRA